MLNTKYPEVQEMLSCESLRISAITFARMLTCKHVSLQLAKVLEINCFAGSKHSLPVAEVGCKLTYLGPVVQSIVSLTSS